MNTNRPVTIQKKNSWRMFNQIAGQYDLLNRLLSFGIDKHWRKVLVKFISVTGARNVLDLATGTADLLLAIVRYRKEIQEAVGLDLAEGMLQIGRRKIEARGLGAAIKLQHGDAANIPFDAGRFENVTMAFGIRNVEDPLAVLREMHRILAVKGRAIVLEFSLPSNRLLRVLHLFYLRTIVPAAGGLISGHAQAYRYLNQSIETFPYGNAFCDLMRQAGFPNPKAHPLLGGIATIYVGEK